MGWYYSPGQEYTYKTTIKKRPGWSERAIELFLGEPDKKKYNQYQKHGPKRCLYLRNRVLETEKTAEFQEFVRKNRPKVEAGISRLLARLDKPPNMQPTKTINGDDY